MAARRKKREGRLRRERKSMSKKEEREREALHINRNKAEEAAEKPLRRNVFLGCSGENEAELKWLFNIVKVSAG